MTTKLDNLVMLVTLTHPDVLQAFDSTFVTFDENQRSSDWQAAMRGYMAIQTYALGENQYGNLSPVPYPPQRMSFCVWVAERSVNETVREAYRAYQDAVDQGLEQWCEACP